MGDRVQLGLELRLQFPPERGEGLVNGLRSSKQAPPLQRAIACAPPIAPPHMLLGSLLALAAPSLQEAEAARGTLTQLSDGDLKFELFLPQRWQHPAASGSRWPVLVFLHGRGESGGFDVTNAQSLPWQLVAGNNASFVASLGFIVLVPQCPQAWPDANHQLSPKPNPTRTFKPCPYL